MNILLTGFTTRQANTLRESANFYVLAQQIFRDMLVEMGHKVDWRAVEIGEDLSMYDLAMVGLSNPTTMNGMAHRYGGMWALASHRNVLAWFDDFRFKDQLYSWLRKPEPAFSDRLWPDRRYAEHEKAMEWKDRLIAAFQVIKDRKLPFIAHIFEWGDISLMARETPDARWFCRFDISDFVPRLVTDPAPFETRKKAWVSAALTNTDEWINKLGLTWDIVKSTKPKGGNPFGGGWKKIPEPELVRTLYRDNIGILSHPYSHAGSGWWRVRFNYMTQTQSILLGAIEEAQEMGEAFRYSPQEIEAMPTHALHALAQRQTNSFMSYVLPRGAAMSRLQAGIDRATAEATVSALEAAYT